MDGPYDALVSKVGQLTLPLAIRKSLGIETGDRVHFLIADFLNGAAILAPEATMHRWLSVGLAAAIQAELTGGSSA